MHTGLLDVLHDAAEHPGPGVVTQRVHIDLDGVFEEAVHQHGTLGRQAAFTPERREAGELGHGRAQLVVAIDHRHGPAAEHVAGAHQGRKADLVADGGGFGRSGRGAAGRLRDRQALAQGIPALAVLGEVDRIGRGAAHQRRGQLCRQLQRRLAAQAHDDPDRILGIDDVEDVLGRQRLEVQPV